MAWTIALSFRNLPAVQIIAVEELSTYDVLRNDWLVFTPAALAKVEGVEELVIDRTSADSPAVAAALRDSRLIYLLGGFPHYLGRIRHRHSVQILV